MPAENSLWPLAVYAAAAAAIAGAMIGLSWALGERRPGRTAGVPYESGVAPTGSAWVRFDVKYFRVAMVFVLFDVESIFIMAWAVTVREAGWPGFAAMAVFIGVLLAALFYAWKAGALEWEPGKNPNRNGAVR